MTTITVDLPDELAELLRTPESRVELVHLIRAHFGRALRKSPTNPWEELWKAILAVRPARPRIKK